MTGMNLVKEAIIPVEGMMARATMTNIVQAITTQEAAVEMIKNQAIMIMASKTILPLVKEKLAPPIKHMAQQGPEITDQERLLFIQVSPKKKCQIYIIKDYLKSLYLHHFLAVMQRTSLVV